MVCSLSSLVLKCTLLAMQHMVVYCSCSEHKICCNLSSTVWLLMSVLLVAECSAVNTFPQKDSSLYKILCVSDLSCQNNLSILMCAGR